jgi:oligopeptidase B
VLGFEEKDETFSCQVNRSKSRKYLFVVSHHLQSTEYRMLEADRPEMEPKLIQAREPGHIYSVEHRGDDFFFRTNWKAKNHRLMRAPVSRPARENWQELIPHREDVLLEGFVIFRDHLVLEERREGLNRLRVRRWDGGEEHYVEFDEPAYFARTGANPEMETSSLRYIYTSLTTPSSRTITTWPNASAPCESGWRFWGSSIRRTTRPSGDSPAPAMGNAFRSPLFIAKRRR